MDRRAFIAGAASLPLLGKAANAQTSTDVTDTTIVSVLPPLPEDLADKANFPPATYSADLVGTAPPLTTEIDAARSILINAPYQVPAVEVASYFLAVGAGAYGQQLRPYAREWPVRANPMIIHFFTSTQTKPEGDVTAWCAAFVNWCLLRSQSKSDREIGAAPGSPVADGLPFPTENLKRFSTNNAASGSFRCLAEVNDPKRGDIVVFRNIGTDDLTKVCQGSGHVTFFLKKISADLVQVVGGNQSQVGSNGAVTIANMSVRPGGRFLKFVAPKGV